MAVKVTYISLLLSVLNAVVGWHDFTNTNFHCWPLTASASNQATWNCAGVAMEWIVPPPSEIKAEESFTTSYALLIDNATFWDWAVLSVGKTNIFSSVGISDPVNASDWCHNTVCPTDVNAVTQTSCCIWHVNVHSCPLEDTHYCAPWIQPSGEVYTHSSVLWGQLQPSTHTNWTSKVDGLYKVGTTQLIAHIKLAGFQVALQMDIKVLPRSECGNSICEREDGEDCSTCPADCGRCPLGVGVIAGIVVVVIIIIAVVIGVVLYFRVKQYRLMWDESWIIPYDEIKPGLNHRGGGSILSGLSGHSKDGRGAAGILGSMISVQSRASDMGGPISNMQAQALTKQIFCKTAFYRSQTVAIKHIPKRQFSLTKDIRREVKEVRSMEHPNLARFIGSSIEVPNVNIVTEYCPKGSLNDALLNENIPLNWAFRFSMATDIARGMSVLHSHKIYHGRLKSTNCIIDDRWTVKVTDFGLPHLRQKKTWKRCLSSSSCNTQTNNGQGKQCTLTELHRQSSQCNHIQQHINNVKSESTHTEHMNVTQNTESIAKQCINGCSMVKYTEVQSGSGERLGEIYPSGNTRIALPNTLPPTRASQKGRGCMYRMNGVHINGSYGNMSHDLSDHSNSIQQCSGHDRIENQTVRNCNGKYLQTSNCTFELSSINNMLDDNDNTSHCTRSYESRTKENKIEHTRGSGISRTNGKKRVLIRESSTPSDFGIHILRSGEKTEFDDDEEYEEEEMYKKKRTKVYLAPEFIGEKSPEATSAGDTYAFGVILTEIGTRNDPYQDEDPEMVEDTWKPPLPDFADESLDDRCPSKQAFLSLIRECWMDNPTLRPSFDACKKSLHRMNPNKMSPVDIMMAMMEKYSKHLESLVAERTAEVMIEKEKADRLLYSMIPQAVAEDLKRGKTVKAEQYSGCTIYFSDIVGFTNLSGGSTAMEVVALLNKLYTTFDSIIDNYDVYKVETIGDAYMVVSGVPRPNGIRHAREIAHMACDLRDASKVFVIPHKPGEVLRIRIGMHSGAVCAGVVGLKMPRYCLFGDTVNTSSRMESNGEAYKIHLSSTTYELLQQLGGFRFEKRGTIPIKGKGDMTTYWLSERLEKPKSTDFDKDLKRKISNSNDSGYNEDETKPKTNGSTEQGDTTKRLPKVTENRESNAGIELKDISGSDSSLYGPPKAKTGWEEMPLVND